MNCESLKQQLEFLASAMRRKSIMVTGATGLLGSSVIRLLKLLNENYNTDIRITALCRNREKLNAIFPYATNVQIWNLDADMPNIEGKVDFVIFCSGISGGSKIHLTDPVKIYDSNVNGPKRVLDWCSRSGAAFLLLSSYEVYGEISQEELMLENQPCQLDTFVLRNIYAETKRMSESLCCAYSAKYGFPVYSSRLTSTFGKGVAYNDPRFFAEFARSIIERRDIVLKSNGTSMRSYLDSDDAAMAMLFVLAKGQSCNAYNLTNMRNAISIRDLAQRMIEVSNSEISLRFDLVDDLSKLGFRKEGCTLMDASKLMALGWNPVYTLDETISKLLKSMTS